MAMAPAPNQKHSASERWKFIERGISYAIPRPKFAAHYLIQLLRKLAREKGDVISDNDTVDKDCRVKVIELEEQIVALTAAVTELQAQVEEAHPEGTEGTEGTEEAEEAEGTDTPAE